MEINNKNIVKEESDKTIRLTKGQSEAVKGLIQFFDSPYDENKRIYGLTGSPGVGKTFVTRYIVNKCKLPNSIIKCCSPTHKACRVLGQAVGMKADTIHSTFGFRLNVNLEEFDYNNPLFKPIGSPKLENIKVLIIDEASMLNAGLVSYINKICNENSIKILYIGDGNQLAPVNERKSTAFTSCVKVYELTEVVRQDDNNPIRELLDIIRDDIKNKTLNCLSFISTCNYPVYNEKGEGFSVINERQFIEVIKQKFNDEEYTKNIELYKTIAYTNLKVNYWNNIIRNTIIQDADKSFITKNDLIMAYETIVDEYMSPIISNSEEYIIKDMVNYTDDKYGFKGYLIKFQMVNGGIITKPLFVIDHRDKFTILQYIKIIEELINDARKATGGNRASKWKSYYNFKENYVLATNIKKGNQIIYSRDIDYAFAITANKSQGSTYDNVFIDVNDICFSSTGMIRDNKDEMLRRLYVAISRAKHEVILSYRK